VSPGQPSLRNVWRVSVDLLTFDYHCSLVVTLAGGNAQAYAYRMKPPISTAPDVLGGTPVFAGTRVPIQTLLDYLECGESIDDFLDGFPSVSRDQIISFLEMAKDRLIESAL
jgi:uncharacterized protein (DUF433 family)